MNVFPERAGQLFDQSEQDSITRNKRRKLLSEHEIF